MRGNGATSPTCEPCRRSPTWSMVPRVVRHRVGPNEPAALNTWTTISLTRWWLAGRSDVSSHGASRVQLGAPRRTSYDSQRPYGEMLMSAPAVRLTQMAAVATAGTISHGVRAIVAQSGIRVKAIAIRPNALAHGVTLLDDGPAVLGAHVVIGSRSMPPSLAVSHRAGCRLVLPPEHVPRTHQTKQTEDHEDGVEDIRP